MYHIVTSQLHCNSDQLTGFYTIPLFTLSWIVCKFIINVNIIYFKLVAFPPGTNLEISKDKNSFSLSVSFLMCPESMIFDPIFKFNMHLNRKFLSVQKDTAKEIYKYPLEHSICMDVLTQV